ncbi:MAG: hypothetical protein JRI36_13635 [Deltaproteobacteria bacterium]|nr:hypothetical protein [Deltaproteobacteria bacterium]
MMRQPPVVEVPDFVAGPASENGPLTISQKAREMIRAFFEARGQVSPIRILVTSGCG